MDKLLLQRERGQVSLACGVSVQPRRPKVILIQKTRTLHCARSSLTFLAGADNGFVFITDDQLAYFSTLDSQPLRLTQPQEVTLKLVLTVHSLLHVAVTRTNKQLQLCRYSLNQLLAGDSKSEQVLANESFFISELLHIDPETESLALYRQDMLEVWDTRSQRKVYTQPCRKAWYSCGLAIIAEEPVLRIVEVDTLRTCSVLLADGCVVSHVEVAGKFLVVMADSFYVVDLITKQVVELPEVSPKLCIQCEGLEDMFVVTESHSSFFLSSPTQAIAFDCEAPLFTYLCGNLALFEGHTLFLIEKSNGYVKTHRLPEEEEVSCIGANITTNEVLLGTMSGSVLIVY